MKDPKTRILDETSSNNVQSHCGTTGDWFLLYLVGCGIFWHREGRQDARRELMLALHDIDPPIRCVASQMLDCSRYDWAAA